MEIPDCNIVIEDARSLPTLCAPDRIEQIVKTCYPLNSVSIVFVTPATMRHLNNLYRSKSGATDMLTFAEEPGTGDMIVCSPHIAIYARRYGIPFEVRFWHLIAHGLAHLQDLNHYEPKEREHFFQVERKFFEKISEFLPFLKAWSWDDYYKYHYQIGEHR
ncbi:MAG: rRNA maturation RNase YbeY [Gammaproteobacteria bacterium]|nr:rRNA maturation RNase YbeY [Gammaproteobacteria bacterium]